MSRSLKYEIPGVDWRRAITDLDPEDALAVFRPEFEAPEHLVVEIGFGRGEFLLALAPLHPDTAFIGIEVSFKRVLKMARKVARAGLENVRLLEARGEIVFFDLLPKASVDEVWVNFSDPWPKDRHARRRVIQTPFVRAAAACLKPGGILHVATDDVPYAQQIDEVLRAESALLNLNAPDPWADDVEGRLQTGYEEEWRAAGRPMHFFEYARPVEGGPVDTSIVAGEARAERGWPVKSGRP